MPSFPILRPNELTSPVPSFAPQIQSLGGVIDNFTKRRLELEREQRAQRAQEARDAYYMRKGDNEERRIVSREGAERAKFNAAQMAAATRSPGAGPLLQYDEAGNVHTLQPKFIRGKRATPPMAPTEQPAGPEAPDRQFQLREPELRLPGRRPSSTMQLRAPDVQLPGPSASVSQVPTPRVAGAIFRQRPSSFFVDDIEDGEIQALPGPDEDRRVLMPQDSFPPGAREGQRFAADDVGESGRKGNPFAEAMPPREDIEAKRQALMRGPETMFVDEIDEDGIQALPGPGETRRVPMERDAFPPGAREGDRFSSEDVGGDGRKGNPFAAPLARSPRVDFQGDTAFVDQLEDDEARVLPEGAESSVTLPRDSLPPGAREGETYESADMGHGGRKGSPFAGPLPPREDIEAKRASMSQPMPPGRMQLGEPEAKVTSVPPTVAKGARYDMRLGQDDPFETAAAPEPDGDRWVYEFPDGRQIVIDQSMQREAKRAEIEDRIGAMYQAMQTAPSPQAKMFYAQEIYALRGQLGDKATRQMQQFAQQTGEREGREGWQDANREDVQEFQGEQGDLNRASAKDITAMKRKRGGAGAKATSSGPGSAFAKLPYKDQRWVERETNSTIALLDREMNWNKLEGTGFDRLDLALENITSKGPRAGAAHMEAMMNFFGYIRGGVPAKNETDEFKAQTGTLWTWLERMGMKLGGKGWNPTEEDKAAFTESLARMPEAQRRGLQEAIIQSHDVLLRVANKNIGAQIEAFKSASTPFKERVQDKINAKMRFIGAQPRQWFQDTPLIPDYKGEYGAGGASGAPDPLEAAFNRLMEQKAKAGGGK